MPEINCLHCNSTFYCKPCLIGRKKYCSKKCFYSDKKGKKQSAEHIEKRAKANRGKKRSEKFKKIISKKQLGSGNSSWKGGVSLRERYKQEGIEVSRYGMTKDAAIILFGGKCSRCFISNDAHREITGLRLTIHHKDGVGRNSKKPNNSLSNLDLICGKCHSKEHQTTEKATWMRKKQLVK